MKRWKNEKEAREEILELVDIYYNEFKSNDKEFEQGDRINYASRVFDSKEIANLVDSALEFWLTSGRYTDEFEKKLGEFLGVKYVSFVNSGSSANLCAFMTLTSPLLKERQVKPGDEMITVAAGFPTTVTPALQYGVIPVFVDVSIPQYNIDTDFLEEALTDRTKVVMLAHTLGNPFDLRKVKKFCDEHNLWLIEDNCDSLGSEYYFRDNLKKFTGTIGDIGTSSFYPPHHMTTGEGGAVYTNNPLLNKIIRSIRDWGRDCSCPSGKDNLCGHRFDGKFGELPLGYDHKYVYSHFGYNLKATDLQAAIGCAQLEKLPDFIKKRRVNHKKLDDELEDLEGKIILPKACANSNPSWFGYLITIRNGLPRNADVMKSGDKRKNIVSFLEEKGIQTRMLFAGNLTKHPCFNQLRDIGRGYRIVGDLKNTDYIMNNSFWVGVYPGMNEDMIDYTARMIIEGVNKYV